MKLGQYAKINNDENEKDKWEPNYALVGVEHKYKILCVDRGGEKGGRFQNSCKTCYQ
jgi:hypothetical protein